MLTAFENDQVMTPDLRTLDAVSLGLEKVQQLRDLKDEYLLLGLYCKASQDVIRALNETPGSRFEGIWSLKPSDIRLEGFMQSVSVLTGRTKNTIDLVSFRTLFPKNFSMIDWHSPKFPYALDLKNQYTAADTSRSVYNLSQKMTHDTTTVKWITCLTLVYLPGSFVAVSAATGILLWHFDHLCYLVIIWDESICVQPKHE